MQGFLNNFAALWSVLLLFVFIAVLVVFIYRVFLRKLIRMKKISMIRSRRELREAAEREISDQSN